jgi:sugar lactone lactonase YvrE
VIVLLLQHVDITLLSPNQSSNANWVNRHTANHAEVKDGYIFSGKYGIGIARNNSAEVKYLTRWWTTVEEKGEQNKSELFRANDGAVDSRGRLWASVMNDPVTTAVGRDSGEFSCRYV